VEQGMIEKMRRLMEDAMFTYHNSEEEIPVKPFFLRCLPILRLLHVRIM